MAGVLDQYHPFRETISRSGAPGGAEAAAPPKAPVAEQEQDNSPAFIKRLKLIFKLLAGVGVLIAAFYLYFGVRSVLHGGGEAEEKSAAAQGRAVDYEEEDNGEWEYQGGRPAGGERSRGIKDMFCRGNSRPAFCD